MTVKRRTAWLTSWVDRLPPRLRRFVPRELAGFAVIGALTFSVDLGLLAVLRHRTALPLAAAVSIAYLVAFGLNFLLNRTLNFHSHAPIGAQVLRYAVVLAGDYLLTVGISTGLAHLGLPFAVARVAASFLVAVFTYSASRWWVFSEGAPADRSPADRSPADRSPADRDTSAGRASRSA